MEQSHQIASKQAGKIKEAVMKTYDFYLAEYQDTGFLIVPKHIWLETLMDVPLFTDKKQAIEWADSNRELITTFANPNAPAVDLIIEEWVDDYMECSDICYIIHQNIGVK